MRFLRLWAEAFAAEIERQKFERELAIHDARVRVSAEVEYQLRQLSQPSQIAPSAWEWN
jgi:hypothetical protein